jgi:hypothetical protein
VSYDDLARTVFGVNDEGTRGADFEKVGHVHDLEYAAFSHTHPLPAAITASYSFGSGWAAYGGSFTASIKKYEKIVTLEGLVKRNAGSETLIATLPVNFRPSSRKLFICWGMIDNTYTVFRIDVESNGNISLNHPILPKAITWLSLDGICFIGS